MKSSYSHSHWNQRQNFHRHWEQNGVYFPSGVQDFICLTQLTLKIENIKPSCNALKSYPCVISEDGSEDVWDGNFSYAVFAMFDKVKSSVSKHIPWHCCKSSNENGKVPGFAPNSVFCFMRETVQNAQHKRSGSKGAFMPFLALPLGCCSGGWSVSDYKLQ